MAFGATGFASHAPSSSAALGHSLAQAPRLFFSQQALYRWPQEIHGSEGATNFRSDVNRVAYSRSIGAFESFTWPLQPSLCRVLVAASRLPGLGRILVGQVICRPPLPILLLGPGTGGFW